MDLTDLEPRKKPPVLKNLDEMSIESLNDYVQELNDEIARVQRTIAEKEKARSSAESVFKK